jgi:hypothetical protein
MSSLTDRVALLEGMLAETGKEIPPANYPPKHEQKLHSLSTPSHNCNRTLLHPSKTPHPRSLPDESTDGDNSFPDLQFNSLLEDHPPPRITPSKKEGLVHMLLSTRGHLSFDQLSGRLRFFGPVSVVLLSLVLNYEASIPYVLYVIDMVRPK